jgi:hypothetical protein
MLGEQPERFYYWARNRIHVTVHDRFAITVMCRIASTLPSHSVGIRGIRRRLAVTELAIVLFAGVGRTILPSDPWKGFSCRNQASGGSRPMTPAFFYSSTCLLSSLFLTQRISTNGRTKHLIVRFTPLACAKHGGRENMNSKNRSAPSPNLRPFSIRAVFPTCPSPPPSIKTHGRSDLVLPFFSRLKMPQNKGFAYVRVGVFTLRRLRLPTALPEAIVP